MSTPVLTRSEQHLYAIQGSPHDYHYYTGITRTGFQILVVISLPNYIGLFFDAEGNLARIEERAFSSPTPPLVIAEQEEEEISAWLRSLGYHESAVRVKRFFLPKHTIGITDLPEYFRAILENPENHQEEEVQAARELRDRWFQGGDYQLWLNPYTNVWVDRFGCITAT
jgi:hypothetical protein